MSDTLESLARAWDEDVEERRPSQAGGSSRRGLKMERRMSQEARDAELIERGRQMQQEDDFTLRNFPEKAGRRGVVYMITSPSGKKYVGQTKRNVWLRWNEHKSGKSCCHGLWHAICKYGWKAMKCEVLEDNIDFLNLDKREEYWIGFHNTMKPNGYNIATPRHHQDKAGMSNNHKKRCAEVMGQYAKRQRKRDLWADPTYRQQQTKSRTELQGDPERVKNRRNLYTKKRDEKWGNADVATRAFVDELARRDAVQGARRALKRGLKNPERDPMGEVFELHGDGLVWKEFQVLHPVEARAVVKEYRAGGYGALLRRTLGPRASSAGGEVDASGAVGGAA